MGALGYFLVLFLLPQDSTRPYIIQNYIHTLGKVPAFYQLCPHKFILTEHVLTDRNSVFIFSSSSTVTRQPGICLESAVCLTQQFSLPSRLPPTRLETPVTMSSSSRITGSSVLISFFPVCFRLSIFLLNTHFKKRTALNGFYLKYSFLHAQACTWQVEKKLTWAQTILRSK